MADRWLSFEQAFVDELGRLSIQKGSEVQAFVETCFERGVTLCARRPSWLGAFVRDHIPNDGNYHHIKGNKPTESWPRLDDGYVKMGLTRDKGARDQAVKTLEFVLREETYIENRSYERRILLVIGVSDEWEAPPPPQSLSRIGGMLSNAHALIRGQISMAAAG